MLVHWCKLNTKILSLPADDEFDHPTSPCVRFQELARVWAIAHSLLLDRVCGTTCRSVYMTLNVSFWSYAPVLLRTAALSDCFLSTL